LRGSVVPFDCHTNVLRCDPKEQEFSLLETRKGIRTSISNTILELMEKVNMNGLNLQIYHLHQFIYNKILILNLLSYPIMMF